MNRRGFFTSLAAIAAGAALDPERLLWVPKKKLISIPAPCHVTGWAFKKGDLIYINNVSWRVDLVHRGGFCANLHIEWQVRIAS